MGSSSAFFPSLALSFCLVLATIPAQVWGKSYTVVINNGIDNSPLPVTIHCYSTENDIGEHVLHYNQNFNFHFKTNIWGSTKFWCDFWWNGNYANFDVFNRRLGDDYCGNPDGNQCYWLVTNYGFALANKPPQNLNDLTLINKWTGSH